VVGDDEPISTELESQFRILGCDDAFDDKLARPALADGFDLVCAETAGGCDKASIFFAELMISSAEIV
jgi:hypothetical protein